MASRRKAVKRLFVLLVTLWGIKEERGYYENNKRWNWKAYLYI